jgi:uncharacterized protein (TIGR00369 family)
MTVEALEEFLSGAFPDRPDSRGRVIGVSPGQTISRLTPTDAMLRPGGIVSGPTQMALVDLAAYAVVLAHIGPVAMAVTSALSINFLRGCPVAPLFASASLIKLGRRLAVTDVRLWQADQQDRPIAQSSVTYAIPG